MKKQSKKPDRVIHIHAKCDAFEIWEHISEDKAVKRLVNIRTNFLLLQKRMYKTGLLVVNTVIVNPTLF